ncbi:MAG: AraC family transcriptional regulator [Chitinophagales bacterium]
MYTRTTPSTRLNFSDPSNFNRFFRSITGLSPRQYRQQY